MELNPDQPFAPAMRRIFIQKNAHHVTVPQMNSCVASRYHLHVVPILVFDEALQLIGISGGPKHSGLFPIACEAEHPAQSQKSPPALFIELSGEQLLRVN